MGRADDRARAVSRDRIPTTDGGTRRRRQPRGGAPRVRALPAAARRRARRLPVTRDRVDLPRAPRERQPLRRERRRSTAAAARRGTGRPHERRRPRRRRPLVGSSRSRRGRGRRRRARRSSRCSRVHGSRATRVAERLGRDRRSRLGPAPGGRRRRRDARPTSPSARARTGSRTPTPTPSRGSTPRREAVDPDDPGRQQPERDHHRRRLRLGGEQPRRHRLADRPRPRTRSCRRSTSATAPLGIAYAAGSVWVANTGDDTITRIDADSGKPTKTLLDRRDRARRRRRIAVGERARRRTASRGSIRRAAKSCSRSASETAPPASPSAAAPPGWRTASTGPCRASIRARTRSPRPFRPSATARPTSPSTRAASG